MIIGKTSPDGSSPSPTIAFTAVSPPPTTVKSPSCFQRVKAYFGGDSVVGASLNLVNSTIGAGILFLPYVLRVSGAIPGLLLISIGGMLGAITLYVLYCAYMEMNENAVDLSTCRDYEQIGCLVFQTDKSSVFGKVLSYFVQLCIFVLNFGGCMAYTIIIGHLLSGWISTKWIHAVVLLGIMCVIVVAGMSKHVSSLRFVSYISIVSVWLFALFVFVFYATGLTWHERRGQVHYVPEDASWDALMDIVSVLGVVSFAYGCHTNLCPIVSEFEDRRRPGLSIFASIFIDFLFYSIIAAFGYLSFASNTQTDIILSYQGSSWSSAVLRVLLAIQMGTTYPVTAYPGRYTLANLFRDAYQDICDCCRRRKPPRLKREDVLPLQDADLSEDSPASISAEPTVVLEVESPEKLHELASEPDRTKKCQVCVVDFFLNAAISIAMGIVCYLLAIFYPEASVVYGIVGSTAAVFTMYVFPCSFYIAAFAKKRRWYDVRTIAVALLMLFGIAFGITVTGTSIAKIIQNGLEESS